MDVAAALRVVDVGRTAIDLDLVRVVALTVVTTFAIFGLTVYATVRFLVRHR